MAFWRMIGFRWWVGMAMLGHAFAGRKRRAGLRGRQRGHWPGGIGVNVCGGMSGSRGSVIWWPDGLAQTLVRCVISEDPYTDH